MSQEEIRNIPQQAADSSTVPPEVPVEEDPQGRRMIYQLMLSEMNRGTQSKLLKVLCAHYGAGKP
jgi:hypothetical protein